MEVKFGKIRPNNNIFINSSASNPEDNFFATNQNTQPQLPQNTSTPGSRLNDFDSDILENNAYQGISDETFKLEHKIGLLENTLTKLQNEIEALESLGYDIQISDLKERKRKVEQELIALNKKYAELGIGARLSGHIASAANFSSKKKTSSFSVIKNFIAKKIFAKISKTFDRNQLMKEALGNLSNINTSVDELINLKVPYGETINRYEKLTAYLNKANVIHSQISRNMNSITKKKV